MFNLASRKFFLEQGKVYPYATGGDYIYYETIGSTTYRVHEFRNPGSSTLNVVNGGNMEYLIVGGGGGGGYSRSGGNYSAGGAGGGGATFGTIITSKDDSIVITVGSGGTAGTSTGGVGDNGGNSSFDSITAFGGGGGGGFNNTSSVWVSGKDGGAGGGGVSTGRGLGTTGQGKEGGLWLDPGGGGHFGGGGGGAAEAGEQTTGTNPWVAGAGGAGVEWPQGSGKYYGGGGGAGGWESSTTPAGGGTGGIGGGGDGGAVSGTKAGNGEPGENGTGGGGGGGGRGNPQGGDGGSGIVIVRYPRNTTFELWTPNELTNIEAWYDASDSSYLYDATSGGSTVSSDGQTILRWEDKSGNSVDLTTSNTTKTLRTTKLNSRNYVDSAAAGLFTAFRKLNTDMGRNTGNLSVITVAKCDTSGGTKAFYAIYANGSGKKRAHVYFDDVVFKYNSIRLDTDTQSRTSVDTGFFPTSLNVLDAGWVISLTTSRFSQQSFRAYINGSSYRNDTVTGWTGNSSDTTSDVFSILGGDYESQASHSSIHGRMAELFVIHDDIAFDDDKREKLEGYLAFKWGLVDKLPLGHTYKNKPPYKVEPVEPTLLSASASSNSNIVTSGLVLNLDAGDSSSYPGSGTTWYDISGNANNVTLTNGPTYDSANNGSIVFDGGNDYADFFAPSLGNTTTVEMWVKLGASYSGKMFFGWFRYDVWCGSGHLGFNTAASDVHGISSATVSSLGLVGNWKHYVFEMRSDASYTNNKIYINGISQSLSQQSGSENSGNRNFNSGNGRISGWRNNTQYPIPMNCSVFRVYNRALSSTEIQQNYNALKGRYGL